MAQTDSYDLLIVGGGAAAFAAAIRAADLGARVLMANAGLPLGGTCVNVGCVPSKFLLEAMTDYVRARCGEEPWLASEATLDYSKLAGEKDKLVRALRQRNYYAVIEALGTVELVEGRARLRSATEIQVGERVFHGQRILLATGARAQMPRIPGLSEAEPLTHVSALELKAVPESLAVLGGGPLGLEFAQIFHRAGARVTVVEMLPRILPQHEPEVSEELARLLVAEGIEVHVGSRVQRVARQDGRVRLYGDNGFAGEAERVLVASGIRPNTEGLGLEEVGVATDARGFIVTDPTLATTVPGIYAAGDVTGVFPLETVAAKQGYLAASHVLTGESRPIDYDLVPHAVFTDPQVAAVGWTEQRLMQQLGTCSCRTLPLSAVPKAWAARDTRGLVKLVVDPKSGRIRGAHAVARYAAEIIHVPLLAMKAGWTLADLVDTVHVFPTYAEAWKLCAQTFQRSPATMSCCIA